MPMVLKEITTVQAHQLKLDTFTLNLEQLLHLSAVAMWFPEIIPRHIT